MVGVVTVWISIRHDSGIEMCLRGGDNLTVQQELVHTWVNQEAERLERADGDPRDLQECDLLGRLYPQPVGSKMSTNSITFWGTQQSAMSLSRHFTFTSQNINTYGFSFDETGCFVIALHNSIKTLNPLITQQSFFTAQWPWPVDFGALVFLRQALV